MLLEDKFSRLATDNLPGQEVRQAPADLANLVSGEKLAGVPVDFSHGDVDAFEPIPGSLGRFIQGVRIGGKRAYTEYRGDAELREEIATKLARFTGAAVSAGDGLIITPGTQGALFLAIGSTVSTGDKVAIVRPDYFANRKLVEFFGGVTVPIDLDYLGENKDAGLDLNALETACKSGVKVLLFSNPNNPTGVVYSAMEIEAVARLAAHYDVKVIVDALYSRQIFADTAYTHLRADKTIDPDNVVTIIGPSKTESLSGYRIGVAFGAPDIIARMEKLQAIVSLRAAGYSQSILKTWFSEPEGWLQERIRRHQVIRDDLHRMFAAADGVRVRLPGGGSYLFPRLPRLAVASQAFIRILRHEAGVIVTPGTEFSPDCGDSIRLNFSQDRSVAIGAVERILRLVERYRA